MFSVAEKKPNTEVTETLRVLCVEALEGQRARRSSFWLRPVAAPSELSSFSNRSLVKQGAVDLEDLWQSKSKRVAGFLFS